ncbi:formylglycine-generating enzyme family protein [Desulfohalovibrio reitneri]|uniref:formylglycine-generating enzyme family protein n=1 Tax=Desulfohalovibrio reitneri TaxID=1307759 RepID=UPI0004A6B0B3|nr:SUMF1/EgtB/PvdO family nonheme iron enzyme [Desulfohalovibrio reitneri]
MTARAAACICLLLLLLPSAARAGLVTDFSARQEDDRVMFDFGVSSEAEQVRVGLLLRLGQTLLDPAELHLEGDLGEISPGPDKRIVWNVLRDFPEGLSGPLSGELRAPDLLREPVAGMRFVRVQGDCFEMGCGPWFPYCEQDEKPVHPVCPDDFLLSVTPVTRAQFAPFLNQTGRTAGDYPGLAIRDGDWVVLRDPEAPATGVSRVVAMAYAAWLSQESGRTYTLPTEAQWEYACRSGGRRFGYGTPTGRPQDGLDAQWRTPSRANLLGVEGMSGGVWEWTAGAYVSYPKPDQTDPDLNGVLRGGRDGSYVRNARCFNRYDRAPGRGGATTGFRLVAAP